MIPRPMETSRKRSNSSGTDSDFWKNENKPNRKRSNSSFSGTDSDTWRDDEKHNRSSGRWTQEEHEAFLQGLKEYGREWKRVAEKIKTRTSAQIRSHAQKYFARLAKRKRSDKVVHRTKDRDMKETEELLGMVQSMLDALKHHRQAFHRPLNPKIMAPWQVCEPYQPPSCASYVPSRPHLSPTSLANLKEGELIALQALCATSRQVVS